jgi:endonuclease G
MQLPRKLLEQKSGGTEKKIAEHFKNFAPATNEKTIELRRRKMINAVAPEDPVEAFERYKGENDLLPINYLQIGYLRSRAIGRIVYVDLVDKKPVVATGFLVSPDLVITNHHVFSDPKQFRDPFIEFDYEYDMNGKERTRTVFALQPDKFFFADEALDLAIIGVASTDVTGTQSIAKRGYIVLNGNYGKADVNDYASIIQHPDGKPMQIGLRENKITNIDDPVFIKYNTDTTSGSSGAAVFNDQWQLIALHSAGEAKKNDRGEYVDKDGVVLQPDANGKIDGTRVVWLDNRGVRVSAIITGITENSAISSNQYISQLSLPTYADDKQLSFLSLPQTETEAKPIAVAAIAQPTPVNTAPIYINISLGNGSVPVVTTPVVTGMPRIEFEKKIEDEIDFSDCKGFDEYFMDEHTPMPKLSDKLKNKVARLIDNPNSYTLKYFHYSSIFHAVRRMPVVSAINILGKKRFDELDGRNDNWFRDRRIDLDVQLTDDFYAYSGFDKGHMVRREDAEWGTPMSFAEKAANYTCSYANACPQVPDLNRNIFGYHGDWGKIEGEILENGVKNESGDQSRICVYNGPIFASDDQHFKGVQIPLRFYKIVVWRNVSNEMRTTAFILSQEKLVSAIEWEELRFDQIFKEFHTSVANIESLTGLTFTKIRDWDTFDSQGSDEDERLIVDDRDLKRIIVRDKELAHE